MTVPSKKRLWIAFIALLCSVHLSAESTCPQACDKFIVCTEEINKGKATVQQKTTLSKGCSDSCKKHQEKMIECFDKSNQEGGSCGAFSACVMKYAQVMKSAKK